MRIGSLFAGIGGLELGLEWAGVGETVWQVERDPFCRAVLERHWPHAARFDDVRTVGAGSLAPVDLICGGFPCQDVSVAGAMAGLGGARSGLWSEFDRLIGEIRPAFAVVENVANLLAIDAGGGFGLVLGDLAARGYDALWDCVPAAAVGAPHGRDRVFVVAYPGGARGARLVAGADSCPPRSWRLRGAEDLQAIAGAPFVAGDRWPQPLLRRMDDGLPGRVHRLRAIGNAVVPQVGYVIGRVVMAIALEAA